MGVPCLRPMASPGTGQPFPATGQDSHPTVIQAAAGEAPGVVGEDDAEPRTWLRFHIVLLFMGPSQNFGRSHDHLRATV
ncbi:MAG: hypothetical protein B7Z15_18465, partial [Rhizobiales bacterium 32-66-8]